MLSETGPGQPEEIIVAGRMFAGRFLVLEQVGVGAMAAVYRCLDKARGNQEIALKLLSPKLIEDEVTLARFRNEVAYARMFDHPNIVRVYDFGQADALHHFISMEFVAGGTIGSYLDLEEIPFSFDDILQILTDIASGLQFAHDAGIVHRDLKPENILLTAEKRAKVTDFGLARSLTQNLHLTQSGEAVGTPCYMAPEQFRGEAVDSRTDIYAYGMLAFELACGHRPFCGETYHAVATAHLLNPMPSLRDECPNIPSWYQDFVELCGQKDPNDRFQSMSEILQELQRHRDRGSKSQRRRPSASQILRRGLELLGLKHAEPENAEEIPC